MGRVIPLHADKHLQVLQLLPWYATSQLDAADQAEVQAHLAGCAECQAEVRFQRRLDAEIEALPMGIDQGWDRMKLRLQAEPAAARPWRVAGRAWLGRAAALAMATGWLLSPALRPVAYHALGAGPENPASNVVVLLRPDAGRDALARALKGGHLRLIRGPTAAGAYLLQTPPAERVADLAALRRRSDVISAEPIDSGVAP